MSGPSRQLVSLLLAGLYASVAAFGHALHTHCGCEDGCESVACADACCEPASEPTCSCGHSHRTHCVAQPTRTKPTGPTYTRPGHDPSQCAACALIAQLKLGHATAEAPLLAQAPAELTSLSHSSAFVESAQRLPDARGPPASRG